MSQLADLEPPSSQTIEDFQKLNIPLQEDSANPTRLSHIAQSNIVKGLLIPYSACKDGIFGRLYLGIQEIARNFVVGNKYLPHFAICTLGLVVSAANISDHKAQAALYGKLIYIEPVAEESITTSVDPYTPLIRTDSQALENFTLAATTSDGFNLPSGSVATMITARTEPLPDNSNKTVSYTVREGDTLTNLGWQFGVKLASIKYANNMDDLDLIRPGMKLKVPAKGYEVPQALIDKQAADKKAKLALASRNTVTRSQSSKRTEAVDHPAGSKNNGYPYGWCTYYVATKRQVPTSMGNAKNWLNSARNAGFSTGSAPAAGAIVVTSESWLGHVAYVEKVDGDSITISEMNYKGWGITSYRTISANSGFIKGFIY